MSDALWLWKRKKMKINTGYSCERMFGIVGFCFEQIKRKTG